jgi:hypothetical protein
LPAPGEIDWDDRPLAEDLIPGGGGLWTREVTRSRDGQWLIERAINPDGQLARERVAPTRDLALQRVQEAQEQYQAVADEVVHWRAQNPNTPEPVELASQLSQLRDQRDRWQNLATEAAPPVVPVPTGPSPDAEKLALDHARKLHQALQGKGKKVRGKNKGELDYLRGLGRVLDSPEAVREALRERDAMGAGVPADATGAAGAEWRGQISSAWLMCAVLRLQKAVPNASIRRP